MSVLNTTGDLLRLTIAPAHHQVTNVHDNCILQGRYINEHAWFGRIFDLGGVSQQEENSIKASNYLKTPTVILKYHGNGAPVTVGAHPGRSLALDIGRWNWWVVKQTQLIVVPGVGWNKMILILQTNAKCHRTHDAHGRFVALPVEIFHEGLETGQNMFRKPLIRLVLVILAAYFITFLWPVSMR